MKSSFNFICLVICLASCLFGAVMLHHQETHTAPAQRSDLIHSAPPPGYAIQTNGKDWRWTRKESNGLETQWLPLDTREEAVKNAWTFYNFDTDRQEHPWRLESLPTDPNAGLIKPVEPMPMIDNRTIYQLDPKITLTLGSGKGTP